MPRATITPTLRNILLAVVATILLVTTSFLAGRAAASPAAAPGTEGDPLVARSYVDSLFRWRLVVVPAGRDLIGSEGTEIILRAGQARVIASQAGGLADVTAGVDRKEQEAVRANHLLVVPRSDGRGLRAVTEVILLVRGEYEIR